MDRLGSVDGAFWRIGMLYLAGLGYSLSVVDAGKTTPSVTSSVAPTLALASTDEDLNDLRRWGIDPIGFTQEGVHHATRR